MSVLIIDELRAEGDHRAISLPDGGGGFRFDPDAWVELAYPCEVPRKMVLDDKAVAYNSRFTAAGMLAMVEKFRTEGIELLVNVDHLARQLDQKTEAAAWLTDLKLGDDGHLYGKFRWTTLGQQLAEGGVYRFVSVEVNSDSVPRTEWPDKGAVWDRIEGVAITNRQALKGLQPFCHRAEGEEVEKKEATTKGKNMEAIKELLGLPADATDEQVADAIKALQGQVETFTAEKAEAEAEKKAEEFRQKFGDRFESKDAATAFFRAFPEQAATLAGTVKVVEKIVYKNGSTPVSHRKGGTPDEVVDKTPAGLFRKWDGMDDGPEKDAFLDAHASAIGNYTEEDAE